MKHLRPYELLESSNRNLGNFSSQRFKSITGNDSAPGFGGWIYGLLKTMQNRFEGMDGFFKSNLYVKTGDGQTIDTGLGWLLGTAGSLATGVLSKIFEPGDFISTNQNWGSGEKGLSSPSTEADVKPEHLRLMNNKFVNNDLPNINSDTQMEDYIGNSYKKWGVAPGQSSVADDLLATNANTYYNKTKGYPFTSPQTNSKLISAAKLAANFIPAGRAAKIAGVLK
jgi:hypothetical protein